MFEADILARLREIRDRRQGSGPAALSPEDYKITGIEATFEGGHQRPRLIPRFLDSTSSAARGASARRPARPPSSLAEAATGAARPGRLHRSRAIPRRCPDRVACRGTPAHSPRNRQALGGGNRCRDLAAALARGSPRDAGEDRRATAPGSITTTSPAAAPVAAGHRRAGRPARDRPAWPRPPLRHHRRRHRADRAHAAHAGDAGDASAAWRWCSTGCVQKHRVMEEALRGAWRPAAEDALIDELAGTADRLSSLLRDEGADAALVGDAGGAAGDCRMHGRGRCARGRRHRGRHDHREPADAGAALPVRTLRRPAGVRGARPERARSRDGDRGPGA